MSFCLRHVFSASVHIWKPFRHRPPPSCLFILHFLYCRMIDPADSIQQVSVWVCVCWMIIFENPFLFVCVWIFFLNALIYTPRLQRIAPMIRFDCLFVLLSIHSRMSAYWLYHFSSCRHSCIINIGLMFAIQSDRWCKPSVFFLSLSMKYRLYRFISFYFPNQQAWSTSCDSWGSSCSKLQTPPTPSTNSNCKSNPTMSTTRQLEFECSARYVSISEECYDSLSGKHI